MSHLLKVLAMGALIALAGFMAIALAPWFDLEQEFGLPWMYQARGPAPPPDAVAVVAIDERADEALGAPPNLRDWPRALHAELVRDLAAAGARIIVFDMTFDAPGARAEDDAALAAAFAEAGNVIVSESMRKDTLPLDDGKGHALADVVIERTVPPLPALAQAALGHAPFLLPKAARVDAWWTFRNDAFDAPTLPVLALRAWASERTPARIAPLPARERARIDGVLARLRGRGDVAFLDLYGPPRTLRTLPYAQVLLDARAHGAASAAAAATFAGKAVFVGYSARTPGGQDRLRDDHRTVYTQDDGMNLSGVEIAASAFANLLQDRTLRPLSAGAQLAIAAAWALLLAPVCRGLRPAWALLLCGALVAAWLLWVLDRFTMYAQWWPSIVLVGVQLPLALFAGVWLHYGQTRRERERMQRSFGYYVPRSVVDELAGGKGSMTQGNRVVFGCCLASDASKYTTLAEAMEPAQLGRLLNDYYAELFVPVERSGGVVVDVVGDAMVAVWTGSEAPASLRRKACEAALEIVAAIERFNRADAGRPVLDTRLGLHCGDVLIGNVGASQHYEYRAVGDTINTASRLQGLNKLLGTRLLASAETVDGLDGLLTRPLGSFLLVGKANALPVVELIGADGAGSGATAGLCARFAQALERYAARQWRSAADEFAALAADWPLDAATRFYLERCTRLLADPPGDAWSPTITVDVK